MSIDVIGNFLTIVRNATMVSKPSVIVDYSRMRHDIANILLREGFIKDVVVEDIGAGKKKMKLTLKYVRGESVIHEITRISTPGRRVYLGIGEVRPVIGGLGLTILSTNRGVVSHKQAKQFGAGGEILCTVW